MTQKEPNIAVETFLALVKWFLVILIVNNLIWAGIHFGYYSSTFNGTEVNDVYQGGSNNNQEIANG